MKYVAYHRTSTKEQKLDRGIHELKAYAEGHDIRLYKDKVYTDQRTGKDFNRPAYSIVKEEVLESGDALIITELDRLGRSKKDTLKELEWFKRRDIRVMILEIPTTLMDFGSMDNNLAKMMLETISNMMLELYATLAEAEIKKKEKRQREGIERMKANGEWDRYGRPSKMKQSDFDSQYEACRGRGMNPGTIMKAMDLPSPTYYRYRGKYLESHSERIVKRIVNEGYQLSKYDQDHIKMLLSESNSLSGDDIYKLIIESKNVKHPASKNV